MTRYGFVASGGGYRSFYTAGALVWLKRNNVPVVHIASTSSGSEGSEAASGQSSRWTEDVPSASGTGKTEEGDGTSTGGS